MNLRKIAVSAVTMVGAIILVGGFVWLYQTHNFVSRALGTKGVIMGFLEVPEGQQPPPEQSGSPLVIRFVDERTGEEYTLVTKTGLHPFHYAYKPSPSLIGQEVDILYDPENPNNAIINSFLDIWLGPIAVTVFGCVLSSVGLILVVHRRRTLESLYESSSPE